MFEAREIGWIDGVVKKAQIKYKANYIKDAYITTASFNCVQIVGEGMVLQQQQQKQKQKHKRSKKTSLILVCICKV